MKESVLTRQAIAAMRNAIRKVVADHRRRNRPLAVWQDGKVVMLPPERALMVRGKLVPQRKEERTAHHPPSFRKAELRRASEGHEGKKDGEKIEGPYGFKNFRNYQLRVRSLCA